MRVSDGDGMVGDGVVVEQRAYHAKMGLILDDVLWRSGMVGETKLQVE